MNFHRLLPRFNRAPIDDDRQHGLIVADSITGAPAVVTGTSFDGGAIVGIDVTILDGSGNPTVPFSLPSNSTPLPITASNSGVTNLVAAVSGKSIRVLQLVLIANGAVNVKFQSHVTPTDLTGLFYLVANTGFSAPFSPIGQFQTTQGEALDINLSQSVAIGGYLSYTLV